MANSSYFDKFNKNASISGDIFKQVFESCGEAVLITDGSFSIIDANAAGCEFCGYEIDEIKGIKLKDFIHPHYISLFPFLKDTAAPLKQNFTRRTHLIKKDKTAFPTIFS